MTEREIKTLELVGYKFKNNPYINYHNGNSEDDWQMFSPRLKTWIFINDDPANLDVEYCMSTEKLQICRKIIKRLNSMDNILIEQLMKMDSETLLHNDQPIQISPTISFNSLYKV